MLNVARGNPQVEWHQMSATELPFDKASFDVVLCQQGLQYFPDRAVAMKEMARVLAPGGRIALNVWGALERQPFFVAATDAIGRFLGADAQTPFSAGTARRLQGRGRGVKGATTCELALALRFQWLTLRITDAQQIIRQLPPMQPTSPARSTASGTTFGRAVSRTLSR
jgi:SAM-dependent methyltransferase